jgi:hypothetical protein
MHFTRNNETLGETVHLTFRATGEIDFNRTTPHDLAIANQIMSPIVNFLHLVSTVVGIEIEVWKFVNWFCVSIYWTILADLGQISPTTYAPLPRPVYYRDDFSTALRHSSANNIFVNETLFDIYSTFLLETLLPVLNSTVPLGGFAPLSETNNFAPAPMPFKRSYSCTVRRWKSPLGAFVSIVVAQYAFIRGAFSLFMFTAAWYQKRKAVEGMPSDYLADYSKLLPRLWSRRS